MCLSHRITLKTVSPHFLVLVFALTFTGCSGGGGGEDNYAVANCVLNTGTLDNCTLE